MKRFDENSLRKLEQLTLVKLTLLVMKLVRLRSQGLMRPPLRMVVS